MAKALTPSELSEETTKLFRDFSYITEEFIKEMAAKGVDPELAKIIADLVIHYELDVFSERMFERE